MLVPRIRVRIQSFVKAHVKVGFIEDVLACLSLYSRLSHLLSIIFHFTAFIVLMFVIRNKSQISNLKSTINYLSGKLAKLESQSDQIIAPATNCSLSSIDVVRSSKPMSTNAKSNPSYVPSVPVKSADSSRKFNIVVYGVMECDNGTNRHARLVHDTNKIDSIISIIDSNIPESSIRDCTRLGRYSENICRPILAKLSRTCEVSSILSQRHKLKGSKFSVKPELTKEE